MKFALLVFYFLLHFKSILIHSDKTYPLEIYYTVPYNCEERNRLYKGETRTGLTKMAMEKETALTTPEKDTEKHVFKSKARFEGELHDLLSPRYGSNAFLNVLIKIFEYYGIIYTKNIIA